jgi:dTDP-4-dehydrorhamnose 3,5-epimerase
MAIEHPKITVRHSPLEGVLIIEPKVFGDERGWFSESFNAQDFSAATGVDTNFVQDNHSFSHQSTLRGLHYQKEKTQGKLIRVIAGSIFDVTVDLRRNSLTYGKWYGLELSAANHLQVWIPPGFAHGFLVLSESAEISYKVTDYYHPQSEVCLVWNDPSVGIQWPLAPAIFPNLNSKDLAGLSWGEAPKF